MIWPDGETQRIPCSKENCYEIYENRDNKELDPWYGRAGTDDFRCFHMYDKSCRPFYLLNKKTRKMKHYDPLFYHDHWDFDPETGEKY